VFSLKDGFIRSNSNVDNKQPIDNFNFNILKLKSCNCHGYNASKLAYISSLLTSCDILFLQEHCLSESQLNALNSVRSNTHLSVGLSGFSHDDILMGRPYGGCAIF